MGARWSKPDDALPVDREQAVPAVIDTERVPLVSPLEPRVDDAELAEEFIDAPSTEKLALKG
jgi:hypothetical protein